MKHSKNTIFLLIFISFLMTARVYADRPPSAWSMDLMGGATFGYFTFDSEWTPHGGINLRYSINPILSVYGNAGGGQFRSKDPLDVGRSFENLYQNYGLGVRLNILRMIFGSRTLTHRLGLYTQTGLGTIINDVEVTGSGLPDYAEQNFSGAALLYRFGGGLTIRISRRLDFFTQAEVNFSDSDLLDGFERISGSPVTGIQSNGDSYIHTSAGFSIKFGSREAAHSDWYRRDHRTAHLALSNEEAIQRIETELDLNNNTMESVYEKLRILERSINDLHHLVNSVHSDQILGQHNKIETLQTRLQLMQSELDELSSRFSEQLTTDRHQQKESRKYYVVSGVFRNLENAESQLRNLKRGGYDNAEIIRDRGRQYYLVVYNGYYREEEAVKHLEKIRAEINPDSWIYEL